MGRLAFTLFFAFVPWFALIPAPSFAQSQSPSAAQPANTDAGSQTPQPNAAPATQKTPAKVWTNDDVTTLRYDHGISTTGNQAPKKVSATSKSYSQEKDPAWYRKQ